MQRPTANAITQAAHLTSQAVDYSWYPDPTIYAPEDGRIESYAYAGDCGNNLKMRHTDHVHSFCHLEKTFVQPGQWVTRGQPIGVMGYTGYTIPTGAGGRHLHHFIRYDNGTYRYPPSIANESFITIGGEEMITKDDTGLLRIGHTEIGGWGMEAHDGRYDDLFLGAWVGKPVKDFIWAQWNAGQPYRAAKAAQAQAVNDLNNSLNGTKKQLEEAKIQLEVANAKVIEESAKATEAGLRAAELTKDKEESVAVGNSFLQWIGNLLRGQK